MAIKKVIAKRADKYFYKNFRINNDLLNIIYSYVSNDYLNEKEKKKYLIHKMNELLKQKIRYFIYPNNDFHNNYSRVYKLHSINLNHFFETFLCELLLINQCSIRYAPNEGRYISTIIDNKYEVTIRTLFKLDEFTTDSLKAMRSVLYRLRYLDKKGDVYYLNYSLKKNSYKQIFNFGINFIVTLNDEESNQINEIIKNKVNNKKIYDIKNTNPLGENNKKVIDRFNLIRDKIINRICDALDMNLKKI